MLESFLVITLQDLEVGERQGGTGGLVFWTAYTARWVIKSEGLSSPLLVTRVHCGRISCPEVFCAISLPFTIGREVLTQEETHFVGFHHYSFRAGKGATYDILTEGRTIVRTRYMMIVTVNKRGMETSKKNHTQVWYYWLKGGWGNTRSKMNRPVSMSRLHSRHKLSIILQSALGTTY